MLRSHALAIVLLVCLSGCLSGNPDHVTADPPKQRELPSVEPTQEPAPPPHDLGLLRLPAGESGGYVHLSTRGFDDGIRVFVDAATLNGNARFYFAALNPDGSIIRTGESTKHKFSYGDDIEELTIRFYSFSEQEVFVILTGAYIVGQGPLTPNHTTLSFPTQPTVGWTSPVEIGSHTVAARLEADIGEYTLRDPRDFDQAHWPDRPYTLTELRGTWSIEAGILAVGTVEVRLTTMPDAPDGAA